MHSCRVFNVSGKCIRGEFSKTKVLLYKRSWVTLSVTSRREISRRDVKKNTSLPCRDVDHYFSTSVFEVSVTSQRDISRRDVIFNTSLSRRDVISHVATSNFKALCHVATWNSHVVTWTSHVATSLSHVATSFGHLLCHVAT